MKCVKMLLGMLLTVALLLGCTVVTAENNSGRVIVSPCDWTNPCTHERSALISVESYYVDMGDSHDLITVSHYYCADCGENYTTQESSTPMGHVFVYDSSYHYTGCPHMVVYICVYCSHTTDREIECDGTNCDADYQ